MGGEEPERSSDRNARDCKSRDEIDSDNGFRGAGELRRLHTSCLLRD
jgi:hypothetical protein